MQRRAVPKRLVSTFGLIHIREDASFLRLVSFSSFSSAPLGVERPSSFHLSERTSALARYILIRFLPLQLASARLQSIRDPFLLFVVWSSPMFAGFSSCDSRCGLAGLRLSRSPRHLSYFGDAHRRFTDRCFTFRRPCLPFPTFSGILYLVSVRLPFFSYLFSFKLFSRRVIENTSREFDTSKS